MQADLERLVRDTHVDLHAYCARSVGADAADDTVAEVFLTVAERWSKAPADDTERRRWLFGIARNKVYEEWRRLGREEQLKMSIGHVRVPITCEETDYDSLDLVRSVMRQLPEDEAQAWYLTVIVGYRSVELSRLLNVSASTLANRIQRATRRLRTLVSADAEARRVDANVV